MVATGIDANDRDTRLKVYARQVRMSEVEARVVLAGWLTVPPLLAAAAASDWLGAFIVAAVATLLARLLRGSTIYGIGGALLLGVIALLLGCGWFSAGIALIWLFGLLADVGAYHGRKSLLWNPPRDANGMPLRG